MNHRLIAAIVLFASLLPVLALANSRPASAARVTVGPLRMVDHPRRGYPHLETSIAASPLDASFLVAASKTYRYRSQRWDMVYVSHDAGKTWTQRLLPALGGLKRYRANSDPSVAFDARGDVFVSCLAFDPANNSGPVSQVVVTRSSDGGKTWTVQAAVPGGPAGFNDKDWLAADDHAASPYANRVYAAWYNINQGMIEVSTSTDGGQSFGQPVALTHNDGGAQSPVLAVSPDGTLNIVWYNSTSLRFARSTNGGVSFSQSTTATFIHAIDGLPNTSARFFSFPTLAVDTTGLYLAWTDARYGAAQILLVHSLDGGQHWSAPVRVNSDPPRDGRDKVEPAVAVAPNGDVVVSFYDRRNDPANTSFDVYIAVSSDHGATFAEDQRVTPSPFNPNVGIGAAGNMGDYTGLAVSSTNVAYPFFTDSRTGTQNVYTAAARL